MRISTLVAFVCTLFLAEFSKAQQIYEPVKAAHKIPRQPWHPFTTIDSLGRTINFYLSETKPGDKSKLPLVVYIHGSGGMSLFEKRGESIVGRNGHSTINDVFRNHARLLIVEKPGIQYLSTPGDSGLASSQHKKFREEHTLQRWCEAIHAAINASLRLPEIIDTNVLVIGHSEGALVAAKLSADYSVISHVAVLSGGGPTQLYDLTQLAKKGTFFSHISENGDIRIEYLHKQWNDILKDPDNSEKLFFGHSYKRWSSFMQTSLFEQLQKTEAKILIAQGGIDPVVAVETSTMLYTQLLTKGKNVKHYLIPDADHNFIINKQSGEQHNGWPDIHTTIKEWYLSNK